MKLIAILTLAVCLQSSAAGFAQKVSLHEKNASLEKIFGEIRKQTGYEFLYNSQTLAQAKKVDIQVNNAGIAQALQICFRDQPFSYALKGNIIVITPLPAVPRDEPQQQKLPPPTELSGTVTDVNGKPLAGASVMIVELNKVVVTDNNGHYSIQLPAGTYTLEASFISFGKSRKKNVAVKAGADAKIHFVLEENSKELEEVVVTALGIERERRALGYATTIVRGEALTEARSNNWLDALSGKVPGLNLIRSNAGPAGSTKVILRGENNLNGENDALIVVDGVVINHGSARRTATAAVDGGETAIDYGTSLNDINPDDIETVTVLKGPGAAALYGGRGGNGAIVITTKWGKPKTKGLGISLNSNVAFESINRMPSLQYEYGQGDDGANYYSFNTSEDGANTSNTTKAFGPKFNGQLFYQYDPLTHTQGKERTPWVPYKGGFNDFFVTGKTYTNTVTVDGGTERTSARFSYTNLHNTWIVPNTGYNRNTVAVSVNSRPSKNLQITTKVNYTNKSSDNLPAAGYGQQTIMYGYIFWQPNAPVAWLKDYWARGQENLTQSRPFTSTVDNPYAITHEMLNTQNRNSVTGAISATYNIAEGLILTARTSMDMAYDQRAQQRPMDAQRFRSGMYRTQSVFSQEMNSDVLLKYTRDISNDVNISASLGGSLLRNHYNKDEVRADSLIYPGIFTMANSAGILVSVPYKSKYAINSLYGLITAGYKDFAYLDLTLRNDWTSMLATPTSKSNVSILYPSVNASLILSEMLTLPEKISYAKVRSSIAGVGSGQNTPYRTSVTYSASSIYPGGGLYNPTTLANVNLRPLYTVSYEAGVEAKFFSNRLGFDVTLYKGNTRDQILTSTADPASGMTSIIVNAGMVRNEGVEVSLSATPVSRKKGLKWDVTLQYSSNRNTVAGLTEGMDELVLQNGPGSNGFIIARPGGSMGDLYGRGYLRAPDGQIVYNAGFPVITDSLIHLGNTMPKWRGSLSNQFRFGNFRASFLVDGQYGSLGYSLTQGKMAVQGKSTATLPGRYNGIVGTGVVQNHDGTYSPNTLIVESLSDYYDAHFGVANVEGSTFSTDFIKLRECRIDYTFKAKTLKPLGLQKASIGLYGRDLLILSRWPGFDPEFGTLSGADINRGFETGQFPSTRSYGVNLTVAF